MNDDRLKWSLDDAIEVELSQSDDFLKVMETLSRIGDVGDEYGKLYQTCFILHKRNRYFIIHYKGLESLDGKDVVFDIEDFQKEVKVAKLLEKWGLLKIKTKGLDSTEDIFVKVVPHSEKDSGKWTFVPKYVFGSHGN